MLSTTALYSNSHLCHLKERWKTNHQMKWQMDCSLGFQGYTSTFCEHIFPEEIFWSCWLSWHRQSITDLTLTFKSPEKTSFWWDIEVEVIPLFPIIPDLWGIHVHKNILYDITHLNLHICYLFLFKLHYYSIIIILYWIYP